MRKHNIILFLLLVTFIPLFVGWSWPWSKDKKDEKIDYVKIVFEGEVNNQVLVVSNIYIKKLEIKLDVVTKRGREFSRTFSLSPGQKEEFGRYKIGMRWEKGDKYTITIIGVTKGRNVIAGECN